MRLPWCCPAITMSPLLYYSSRNVMASLHLRRKEKVVVLMGATGSGKTSLSIDLASLFPSEIINSDKIQVYHGLDITTNKIPLPHRRNIPHHLLGDIHGAADLSPSAFRSLAAGAVSSISSRRRLPLLVGGSNSFIHALLADLTYHCCFIWVDVSFPVLHDYLCDRVDHMLESGMFEELADFYLDPGSANRTGLRRAIGVPEFDKYFRKYPPGLGGCARPEADRDPVRARAYEEAVREIKENTRELVKRQLGKIQRLRAAGWDLQRVDATEAFRVGKSDRRRSQIWESEVLEPSVQIVKRFLED